MSKFVPASMLILFLAFAACAPGLYRQGVDASERGDYDRALALLYEAVRERPDDYRAWRELGVAWYRTDSLGKAEEAFAASNRIRPNAFSNFYLGLIFERIGETEKAIRVYGAAANLRGDDRAAKLIRERLGVLIDRQLADAARRAVRDEDTLAVHALPENSVAVINFDGSRLSPEYQPIALGLAELVAVDLSKVSTLRVLERVKINVILDELKLGESRFADARLAPRMGKLLGSRRIVLGTVSGIGDSGFRIDGRLVDTDDGTVSGTQSHEGVLERFFDAEKQFVFVLLDTLGVSITKAERDAIEEIPTESLLAFMAFSEGLSYERRGMYEDARRSFMDAGSRDPGFIEASLLARKMELTSSYREESRGGADAPAKSFEQAIAADMGEGGAEADMDRILTGNLVNGNFLLNDELYWNYGSYPAPPPGGGFGGYGTVIIWGHLDAK